MAKPNPLKSIASQVAQSLGKPPEHAPAPSPPAAPAEEPLPELDWPSTNLEGAPTATNAKRGPTEFDWPSADAKPKPTGSKTSREGKRFLGVYVEPRRHEEIRQAALDEGLQVQELVQQAIDEWMVRYGQEAVEAVAARHARRSKRVS